jgi:hypothetical protein
MNQIHNLDRTIIVCQRDGAPTRNQPQKVGVRYLELPLIRQEQRKRSKRCLCLCDSDLVKGHTETISQMEAKVEHPCTGKTIRLTRLTFFEMLPNP